MDLFNFALRHPASFAVEADTLNWSRRTSYLPSAGTTPRFYGSY
jgi:hypothetical protein